MVELGFKLDVFVFVVFIGLYFLEVLKLLFKRDDIFESLLRWVGDLGLFR